MIIFRRVPNMFSKRFECDTFFRDQKCSIKSGIPGTFRSKSGTRWVLLPKCGTHTRIPPISHGIRVRTYTMDLGQPYLLKGIEDIRQENIFLRLRAAL